ncbi:hypothetical protein GCM10010431_59390 [Streptomyces kunmingensis]
MASWEETGDAGTKQSPAVAMRALDPTASPAPTEPDFKNATSSNETGQNTQYVSGHIRPSRAAHPAPRAVQLQFGLDLDREVPGKHGFLSSAASKEWPSGSPGCPGY